MARIRSALKDIPRGAIAIIAFGLFLCVVCAYLTNTELVTGEALEFEQSAEIPNSKPAKLGSDGEIKITDGTIDATRANTSEYRVYRVAGVLNITSSDAERPVDATCTVNVPKDVIFGRTPYRRAAFPNPSVDLADQPVPLTVLVEFNAKGTDVVKLPVADAFDTYTSSGEVVEDWGKFSERKHTFTWRIKGGTYDEPVKLGFIVMWRTVDVDPAARFNCSAESPGSGTASTSTGAALPK